MELAINIGVILLILGFVSLVLKELATSQRNSQPPKANEYVYAMRVLMQSKPDNPPVIRMFTANSLEYMQQNLNMLAFHAIDSAEVRTRGVLTHRMDETGVLRDLP